MEFFLNCLIQTELDFLSLEFLSVTFYLLMLRIKYNV